MIDFDYKSNVVLPEFSQADTAEEYKKLVLDYLRKCYPDYKLIEVRDGMAICTKK